MLCRPLEEDDKLKRQQGYEERITNLQEQLKETHSLLKHIRQFQPKCSRPNERFQQVTDHEHGNCVDRSELKLLARKLEVQSRLEINEKLEQINSFLAEQNKLSNQKEFLHNQSESQLRDEYSSAIRELKSEVGRLQKCLQDKDVRQMALEEQYRELCELIETKRRIKAKLTIDADSSSKRRSRGHNSQFRRYSSSTFDFGAISSSLTPPPPNVTQSLQMLPQYVTHPKTAKNMTDDGRSFKLREELDRSISRHLNSAPKIDIYGVPSKPLNTTNHLYVAHDTAASDYLSSLKRNYLF